MSNLQTRLTDLINAQGTSYKALVAKIGDLTTLTTTAKGSLVAAINEVKASAGAATTTLSALTDVAIASLVDRNLLQYDSASGKWKNTDGTITFQPRDGDLDAIAALTTTSFGRGLLTLANQAALTAANALGTTALAGILRLATGTQATDGTATDVAMTPAGDKAALDARISNDTTLGGASPSGTIATTQNAVQAYTSAAITTRLAAMGVLSYKGTIDASTSPNYPSAAVGDVYVFSVAGKIGGAAGATVEPGDMMFCLVAGGAGTQAAVGANWDIVQMNISGAVSGPANAVTGNLSSFNGATGKVIQDSGVAVDTDSTLNSNSDAKIATQKAVRTYLAANYYTQTQLGNPDTDLAAQWTAAIA